MRRKRNEQSHPADILHYSHTFFMSLCGAEMKYFDSAPLHIQEYFSIVVIFVCLCYPMFKNIGLEVVSWLHEFPFLKYSQRYFNAQMF